MKLLRITTLFKSLRIALTAIRKAWRIFKTRK